MPARLSPGASGLGPAQATRVSRAAASADPWPAASSVGALLKREGLVRSRPPASAAGTSRAPTTPMDAPNAVWTTDFKGQFRTQNGVYCYPLTVCDGYSRYLLISSPARGLPSVETVGARACSSGSSASTGSRRASGATSGFPSPRAPWDVRLRSLPGGSISGSPRADGAQLAAAEWAARAHAPHVT